MEKFRPKRDANSDLCNAGAVLDKLKPNSSLQGSLGSHPIQALLITTRVALKKLQGSRTSNSDLLLLNSPYLVWYNQNGEKVSRES